MKTTQLWFSMNPLNLKGTTMLELPKEKIQERNLIHTLRLKKNNVTSLVSEVKSDIIF